MDRLAELAEYDRSIPGLIDDDFLAAGFTPDEVASYRGTFTPPSLTPQDIAQAEQTYGTLQAPDYTMRETSTQRVQDALIKQVGLDPYLAGRYARDIMGDTSPTSQNILDGLGLADLTPLGVVFGVEEGAGTAVEGYQEGDYLKMGLGVAEAGLGVAEAFPLTRPIAEGAGVLAREVYSSPYMADAIGTLRGIRDLDADFLLGRGDPAMAQGVGADVVGGQSFDVTRKDASGIFGQGTERVRYTDPASGGTMEVVVRPDGSASVLELEVPEEFRGQGIGQSLQDKVMQDFPMMGGQVSSKAAATTAYRLGRRPPGKPNATLDEVFAEIDEMSSVNMVSPDMQTRFDVASAPQSLSETIEAKYPDVTVDLFGSPEQGYELSRIVVPEGERSKGVGTQVMEDMIRTADEQGARISLTPETSFGGSSVSRLKDFYKRFGFVENKGKNKDFSTRNTMYRDPQEPKAAPEEVLPAPRNEAEAMAKQVLEMRAAGRAGEVTEEMMAAADDQYMYFNTPLPMDEASRMARARESGQNVDREFYRGGGTDRDYLSADAGTFKTQNTGVFMDPNPMRAETYAKQRGGVVAPLFSRSDAPIVFGDMSDWNRLEAPVYAYDPVKDVDIPIIDQSGTTTTDDIARAARQNDIEAIEIQDITDPGPMRWRNEDKSIREYPQFGTTRVEFNPANIRSRFARFDPKFRNLKNLSAGVGGAAVLTALADDAEAGTPEQQISELVREAGFDGAAQILGVSPLDIEEAISIAVPQSQWDQLVVGQ